MRHVVIAVLLLGASVRWAAATSGTCTVTSARQTGVGDANFGFDIGSAVGVALGVEFDEAAGTFNLIRDPWHDVFGDTGAPFDTIGGIIALLRMQPGTVPGTIDGGGTVSVPDFGIAFATTASDSTLPLAELPDLPILGFGFTTGVLAGAIPGTSGDKRGTSLDFATGSMSLVGIGVIEDAPLAGDLVTGVQITCTLSPIPSAAALPPAPALTKIKGKAKPGKDGETLTLKGTIPMAGTPLALAGATNAVLNFVVGSPGTPVLTVRIGSFTAQGKKLVAARDDTCKLKKGATQGVCKRDGTTVCSSAADCATIGVVDLLRGHKENAAVTAKIVATPKKSSTVLAVKMTGLDLAALTGATTVELWAKGRGASGTATTSGDTKKTIK